MVVKYVIPESIFSGPSGQVDARSWDAALDVVQQSLLGMAVANDVNDEQDFVLTQVFKQCEELRAKNVFAYRSDEPGTCKKIRNQPAHRDQLEKRGLPV